MKKTGVIVSTSKLQEGTVSVEVTRKKFIPGLKVLSYKKKFLVHTNDKNLSLGNVVVIKDCTPVSKRKRHVVEEVIR